MGRGESKRVNARSRVALGILVFMVVAAGTAWGAGPQWLPGFPLRAGENVLLMWLPVPGAQSYNVYRSDAPGAPAQKIASTSAPTHADPAPDTSKTLEYTIRAVVGGKEGDPSPKGVIAGVVPLKTPKFAGFREQEPGKTSILWDAVPNAVFYNLYRSATKDGEYKLVTSVQEARYVVSGIKPGETAFFKVSAVNQSSVESPRSEVLVVKIEVKKEVVAKAVIPLVVRPFKKAWTASGEKDNYLAGARDVALTKEGDFAVASGPDIQVIGADTEYRRRFGGAPRDRAMTWGSASGLGVAADGAVVVAYQYPAYIRIFEPDGALKAEAEVRPPDPKTTTSGRILTPIPADAEFAPDGTIWVSENANCQLIHYDASLKEIGRVSKPIGDKSRNAKEELVLPVKLAIDPKSGKIFVAEGIESRVSIYSAQGKRLGSFGAMGSGAGDFNAPSGMVVTPGGELLVGDGNLARIQAFDLDGKYLASYQDPSLKKPEAVGYPNGLAVAGKFIVYSEDIARRIVAYEVSK